MSSHWERSWVGIWTGRAWCSSPNRAGSKVLATPLRCNRRARHISSGYIPVKLELLILRWVCKEPDLQEQDVEVVLDQGPAGFVNSLKVLITGFSLDGCSKGASIQAKAVDSVHRSQTNHVGQSTKALTFLGSQWESIGQLEVCLRGPPRLWRISVVDLVPEVLPILPAGYCSWGSGWRWCSGGSQSQASPTTACEAVPRPGSPHFL